MKEYEGTIDYVEREKPGRPYFSVRVDGVPYSCNEDWNKSIKDKKQGDVIKFTVKESGNEYPDYLNLVGEKPESVRSVDTTIKDGHVTKKYGKSPEESAEIRRMNIVRHAVKLICYNKIRYDRMDWCVHLLDKYITTGEFDIKSWETIKGAL